MKDSSLVRYAFWSLWFFLVPLGLAVAGVRLLETPAGVVPEGALGVLGSFVRDQPVPAGIVLFTVFEMSLYAFRHYLPLSGLLGVGGRTDLPAGMRKSFEAAAHLCEEVDGILKKRERALGRALPAEARSEITAALDGLREAMAAVPFEAELFEERFRRAEKKARQLDPWRKGEIREYAESILIAILVALLLRAVVVEAFKIPSGSMLPTLQIQDHIFVNKFVYGPVVPFTKWRLFSRMPPKRGDVIVFETPDPDPLNPGQDFIKRVIAVPGDTLEAEGGHPIINGWRVPSCVVGEYRYREVEAFPYTKHGTLVVEFLGDTAYLALYEGGHLEAHQGPYRVAPGEVWVMGDNRHNSSDSRAWFGGRGGGVPFSNVKGSALFVWLPWARMFVNVMGKPQLPRSALPRMVRGIEECLARRPSVDGATPPPPAP